MYFNIPWATKSNPDLIFSSLNFIFLHLIFDLCPIGMKVILLTFQSSIVPNILRFGTFCVWNISNLFNHFRPFDVIRTAKNRSETVNMPTDPKSERSETPKNEKWETLTK
jgi:hypothetical protein